LTPVKKVFYLRSTRALHRSELEADTLCAARSQKLSAAWREAAWAALHLSIVALLIKRGEPMKAYSILVGKCYRTRWGEVREASSNVDEEITYTAYENGDGWSKTPAQRVPLERFAREVEGEVSCPQP
jgi:hypothetical protein